MNTYQIYIGNIKKCTKYEGITSKANSLPYIEKKSETIKKEAILIKIAEGEYVDIDSYQTALEYFKIRKTIPQNIINSSELVMSTTPKRLNALFIDSDTLRPYYDDSQNKTLYHIKKNYNLINSHKKM